MKYLKLVSAYTCTWTHTAQVPSSPTTKNNNKVDAYTLYTTIKVWLKNSIKIKFKKPTNIVIIIMETGLKAKSSLQARVVKVDVICIDVVCIITFPAKVWEKSLTSGSTESWGGFSPFKGVFVFPRAGTVEGDDGGIVSYPTSSGRMCSRERSGPPPGLTFAQG